MIKVGVHVSIAGTLSDSLDRAIDRGCDAFQIFSSNPRTWRSLPVRQMGDAEFVSRRSQVGTGPVVMHTIYLMNLATEDPLLRQRSIDALSYALRRAAVIQAEYVVTHLGNVKRAAAGTAAAVDATSIPKFPVEVMAAARQRVAAAITSASDRFFASAESEAGPAPILLLENSAGAESSAGSAPATIHEIMSQVRGELRLGLCLDTCHAHAAGYDLSGPDGQDLLLSEIKETMGIDALKVIHGNDSKGETGSRLDRHEHIGDGSIGADGFARLLAHPYLSRIPWILETPGDEDDDRRNISAVRALAFEAGE